MPNADLVAEVSAWFVEHARELPWRGLHVSPWGVLVSEVMLQQTPVARVDPVWREWLARWPTPGELAAEPPGAAVLAWGRLGYPRRALRLHAAAGALVELHGGVVPADLAALRALPGVGEYTAAAVLAFGFGQRTVVIDTNVRRVLGRVLAGVERPASGVTNAERAQAAALLPLAAPAAALWSVAVMELGALVCSAAAPACGRCPIADRCRWLTLNRPAAATRRPAQRFAGTDRQVRGLLMAVLREADDQREGSTKLALDAVWPDALQRDRALDSLVADGLVQVRQGQRYRLPQHD